MPNGKRKAATERERSHATPTVSWIEKGGKRLTPCCSNTQGRGRGINSLSTHAEVAALTSSRKNLRGCTAYVFRFHRDSAPAHSKPCFECASLMLFKGIRKTVFFDSRGILRKELVSDLLTDAKPTVLER